MNRDSKILIVGHNDVINTGREIAFQSGARHWAVGGHEEPRAHGLPCVVAAALLDGTVRESSFSEKRLRDPRLAALMSQTSVYEDELLSMQCPESSPCRITVRLKDGSEIINDVRYPKGHDRNPMSAAEVADKFKALFGGYGSLRQAERMIALVDELDRMKDIGELVWGFARRSRLPISASAIRR